jgi:hypothetical protein
MNHAAKHRAMAFVFERNTRVLREADKKQEFWGVSSEVSVFTVLGGR